jgi:hypothetical protein
MFTVLVAYPVELLGAPLLSLKLSQQVSLAFFAFDPPTVISSFAQ